MNEHATSTSKHRPIRIPSSTMVWTQGSDLERRRRPLIRSPISEGFDGMTAHRTTGETENFITRSGHASAAQTKGGEEEVCACVKGGGRQGKQGNAIDGPKLCDARRPRKRHKKQTTPSGPESVTVPDLASQSATPTKPTMLPAGASSTAWRLVP